MDNRKLLEMIAEMGAKTANEYAQLLKEKAQLQEEISSLAGTSEERKKEVDALTQKIKGLEAKLLELMNKNRSHEKSLQELKNINKDFMIKNDDLEDRLSRSQERRSWYSNAWRESRDEIHALKQKNKLLEEKVSSMEQTHPDHDLSKEEIEELLKKHEELVKTVTTLRTEKLDLEHAKQLVETNYATLSDLVLLQQPLVNLALAIREKFWQKTKEEIGLGAADKSLIEAADVLANRPNCQVDAALISVKNNDNYHWVISAYGFTTQNFTMTPEQFQELYVAEHDDRGMFKNLGNPFDMELSNIFAYTKLCAPKSCGRRELREIAARIYDEGCELSNRFESLCSKSEPLVPINWDGTWFKPEVELKPETSAAWAEMRASIIELRELLESLALKATCGENLISLI